MAKVKPELIEIEAVGISLEDGDMEELVWGKELRLQTEGGLIVIHGKRYPVAEPVIEPKPIMKAVKKTKSPEKKSEKRDDYVIDGISTEDLRNMIKKKLKINKDTSAIGITKDIYGDKYSPKQYARVYSHFSKLKTRKDNEDDKTPIIPDFDLDRMIKTFDKANHTGDKIVTQSNLEHDKVVEVGDKSFLNKINKEYHYKEAMEEQLGYTFDVLDKRMTTDGEIKLMITGSE